MAPGFWSKDETGTRRLTCLLYNFFSTGNVAQDLREWVTAAGYNVVVTGGGRIDFRVTDPGEKPAGTALVYGFSYGFGKGDHEKVASIISEWSDRRIIAIVDNSPDLY
jgi:Janus/Ocnus family (Ocnus)